MHEAEQLVRQLGDATSIKDKALRQGVRMADLEAAVRSLVASKVVIGLRESGRPAVRSASLGARRCARHY